MLTTILPENGPAGTVSNPERNIGTVLFSFNVPQRNTSPASSACSKVKEHPEGKGHEIVLPDNPCNVGHCAASRTPLR